MMGVSYELQLGIQNEIETTTKDDVHSYNIHDSAESVNT